MLVKKWGRLIFFIYLFILSIELIKKTSLFLAPSVKDFLTQSLTPIKAVSVGWFATAIVQSSGAVGSITAAFVGNNLLTLQTSSLYLNWGFSRHNNNSTCYISNHRC